MRSTSLAGMRINLPSLKLASSPSRHISLTFSALQPQRPASVSGEYGWAVTYLSSFAVSAVRALRAAAARASAGVAPQPICQTSGDSGPLWSGFSV